MRALALAVLTLAPTLAAAQEIDCAQAMAQVELTFCAEQDWQRADADLNDAYKAALALMRQIDAGLAADQQGAEAHLRAGQRAWVSFRDEACAAEGYVMHGGSAEPMVIYGCRAGLTRQRAEGLWQLAGSGG
ncbi:lysozyme inhibitor LprI family protein [Gemmobacter caeruleus]|uniref:lysozyme inhibitor LprI family protein n=1 Tax=Gemmobacter caeruleus TaxID=2595004 RepID=UPI0019398C22|nr:lysozyme inhibitor LprI family protein [Gemmobacter caeruleus]